MFEQEFLDLSRVDVLSAPDHHVLAASGDPNVAILVHDAPVAGVQPIPLVYGLACPLFIVPVAVHDHETPEAKFALGAKRDGLAFRAGDLYFHMRLHAPDSRYTLFERITWCVPNTTAGQFSHSIDTDEITHVHIVDYPARYIGRHRRATRKPSV